MQPNERQEREERVRQAGSCLIEELSRLNCPLEFIFSLQLSIEEAIILARKNELPRDNS